MNTKKMTIILIIALLFGTASARDTGLVHHEVQVVDERGVKVTTISSVEIYAPDTTTDAVIYSDAAQQNTITLPMTTGSANTTLSDGAFSWYGPDGYDFSITDGTNLATNANHRTRSSSEGTLVFPSYLTAISSTAYLDAESITMGTSLDWVANAGTVADRMTWTPATDSTSAFWIGSTSKTADLNLWGATAGYDLMWDASRNQFSFRDSAVLGFGGAAASAAADFTMYHTADTSALTITAVVADETVHFGDGTIATDVLFQNTTVAGADVWWDDSEEEWNFGGASTLGVDVKFWGTTASTFMLWDESDDELEFDLADLKIHEGSQIEFYHTDTVDWTMDVATGDRILFTPALTNDTANIHFGNATNTSDLALFGATASTVLFDASADLVTFTDYDLLMSDADYVYFGADKDIALHSTTTKYLTITPLAATDDYGVILGVDQSGMDLKTFGATTGEYLAWDASADSLTTIGDLALFTLTGTTKPFYVNVTGTVAGTAIELKTTDGGISLNADGATNGDVTIDAASVLALVSADDLTVDIAGAAGEDLIVTNTGGSIILTATEADVADAITLTAGGRSLIDVEGGVNLNTTYCTFGSNPVVCKNDGTAVAGAASETDFMTIDSTNFEYFCLTAGTQAIKLPTMTAIGLDLRLDALDNEGMELGEGITAASKSAFTIGTDAFYLKVKFYLTDVNDFDILAVGFRLAAAYNQDLYAYNTYAGINVNNGTINGIDELNGANAHETDMGETWSDGATHTLELRISAAKDVTQFLDGTVVTTPLVFSWTDADTVVPFFQILGDASAAGEVAIQSWECGLQY